MVANDGTVTKANTNLEWYDYETKNWANAVVLKENSVSYENNEIIPESNIESYFVWVPKYSYKLWDLGNYYGSNVTLDTTRVHAININFGLENTIDSVEGQCATPMSGDGIQGLSGENGNCEVGEFMTHPAFLAFGTNGLWVGKFVTGYDGATTSSTAATTSDDISKIIIKPNVYSWRNNPIGNAFKISYEYLRNDESHMMKNTEWGAISYLSLSNYGINSLTANAWRLEDFLTGYNDSNISNLNTLSTTGNITGIFDIDFMQFTMGYNMNMTSIHTSIKDFYTIESIYPDFYSNAIYKKYYDAYYVTNIAADYTNDDYFRHYNERILGDAVSEFGPFEKLYDDLPYTYSSWYYRQTFFVSKDDPYFLRAGLTGSCTTSWGGAMTDISFRIVLAPIK